MKKVWIIPIEPLEERYTEQWYRQIPKAFEYMGFDVTTIDGTTLTDYVKVGAFLDMNSTVAYKNSQMAQVAELFHTGKITDGDIFWVSDMEYWGLESLRLMSQLNKINIKIYAFCHAASWTIEDAFSVASPYQKYTELGWIAACDKVFVGSQYHKQAIIDRRIKPYAAKEDQASLSSKIIVSGNPIFSDDYPEIICKKKQQVIISNRFDWEKRPNLSLDFCYILKKKHPDWSFIVTTGRKEFRSNKKWLTDYALSLQQDGVISIYSGLSKAEYHQHLAESKIMLSNSIEESFGYCPVEAMIYGTFPILRNAFSHPELVNNCERFLFDDEDEIVEKIEYLMENEIYVRPYAEKYFKSLSKIIDVIRSES